MRGLVLPCFLLFLLVGVSFAVQVTYYANDAACVSYQGTVTEVTQPTSTAGTILTGAQYTSVSANDADWLTVVGSASLDGFVRTNCTIPSNTGLNYIYIENSGKSSSTGDFQVLAIYNNTNSAWANKVMLAESATDIKLSYNITTQAELAKFTMGNTSINYLTRVWGTANRNYLDNYQFITIDYTAAGGGDSTKPWAVIQLPANNTWYTSLSRTLNYTVGDNVGVSQCKQELNGVNSSLATCANTTFTAVEGTNNIAVWVNDTSNNWNRSLMTTFFTDTIPPSINIQQPTAIWYTTTNRSLNYTTSDLNGLSTCKYELNSVNTTIGTCVNTTFTAVQGSNTIVVWANDSKGNWNKSATITFNVDSIPPTINIQVPANTTYTTATISLNYTTGDTNGMSVCKYELNSVNTTIGTCINTTITAAVGGNSIKVWGNDTKGNWNASATTYFTYTPPPDNTAPTIFMQSPANTTYNISVISLNFTTWDNQGISQCFYELNGGANVSISGCLNTTISPPDGSHRLKLWLNDTSNNWNSTNLTYFFKDATIPNITLRNLTQDPTNDNTPTFTGNVTDALSAVTSVGYRLNGGSWQAATADDGAFNSPFENYTITASVLTDGNYLIEVRAWDALGNIIISYPSDNFTVDTTLPNIVLNQPTNTTYANITILDLNYTTSDINGISFCRYELNGVNTSLPTCANTTITGVEGSNNIKVWANDSAGNWNASAITYFTITLPDATPPTVEIQSPASIVYSTSYVALNYTAGDAGGISQCRYELNGYNTSLPLCNNLTIPVLPNGNTLRVWAMDNSNNWGGASILFNSSVIAGGGTCTNMVFKVGWNRVKCLAYVKGEA